VRDGLFLRARPSHTVVVAPPTYGLSAQRAGQMTRDLISLFGDRP
jgi:hypothetical protein